jgi:acyl dehydratase
MAGLWFEEFEVGMVFNHEWTRTITETDNKWFSLLTMNTQPLHIDSHAAANSVWGRPLVNSLLTLGLMVGMSVNDTTFGTTIANLGMTDVKFTHPLFEGDTIHIRTTVLDKRESKTRPGEGIVTLRHEVFNQDNVLCGSCDRAALMRKRPGAAPGTTVA